MGVTDLDDGIFIHTFKDYNEDLRNLATSFVRSVYGGASDPFYRPVPMDIGMLIYQFSNHGQNMAIFHIASVMYHLISVVLLYNLFKKLQIKELHVFILCLVFAVHPAISQAVAWIPAMNETVLAIFSFSFFICSINYADTGKIKHLALSALFLLLAFFTKETAVFDAPVAFVMIVFVLQKNWLGKQNLTLYSLWVICFFVWYIARLFALGKTASLPSHVFNDMAHRLPLIVQYIGKILLPFNLSVFPSQEDTVYYYGFIGIAIIAASVFFYKQSNLRLVFSGLGIFLLFMLPVLMIPRIITEQTYEHRIYLPMIGILMILPQTTLFQNKLREKQLLMWCIAVAGLLAIINFRHQKSFTDPLSFWTNAVETSPHSSYANMMLAARTGDEEQSKQLFLTAYALNPKERYLNYIYGVMLQNKDSILASEKYFLAEKKTIPVIMAVIFTLHVWLCKKMTSKPPLRTLKTSLKKNRKARLPITTC